MALFVCFFVYLLVCLFVCLFVCFCVFVLLTSLDSVTPIQQRDGQGDCCLAIPCGVLQKTSELVLWWLPHQTSHSTGSQLGLVGPVSVCCDSQLDQQLVWKRGSTCNGRSRSVPEIHPASCWGLQQSGQASGRVHLL